MPRIIPLNQNGHRAQRMVRLPLYKRFVSMTTIPPRPGAKEELRVIDEVGLYVCYEDSSPTDDQVRQHLVGCERVYTLIEANGVADALEKFFKECPGANTGTRGSPAMELRPSAAYPIEIYPECSRMNWTRRGFLVCGKPEPDGLNGENGGCILDGCEPPEDCPIERYFERRHERS